MDTIFAQATVPGVSGIAVIRISGSETHFILDNLTGSVPDSHSAALRKLKDENGALLDEALVLFFQAPKSFTGEDVAELHIHGSRAVTQGVLNYLRRQKVLREALPGEFTKRAFQNGRMDLTQVEALGDLLTAETEAQRILAQSLYSGSLAKKVLEWRKDLIRAAALVEATIDFADEEIPQDVFPEVIELLEKVNSSVSEEQKGVQVAERLREGFTIAIIGAPNVGKSTLINTIANREVAITSPISGTTRDVIEVQIDLSGLPVTFLDTAGLRDAEDEIEKIGIARALQKAAEADLRILLHDGVLPSFPDIWRKDDFVVVTKSDEKLTQGFAISAKTGDGIRELLTKVFEILTARIAKIGTASHKRHSIALQRADEQLKLVLKSLYGGAFISDLLSEDIRAVIREFESLIGVVNVDHLLDEIFSSFCIGK